MAGNPDSVADEELLLCVDGTVILFASIAEAGRGELPLFSGMYAKYSLDIFHDNQLHTGVIRNPS